MTHPYFVGTRHPRVLAHRGLASTATDDAPAVWENSAGAFAAAHAIGVEYIETDCRVTADGELVLFHDATLERLTGDAREIATVSTRELTELFADHGGLLTVAEALHAFPESRFNIDVKTDAALPLIGRAIAPHTRRVLLTSFSDTRRRRAIAEVRRAGAEMPPAASAGRATITALLAGAAARLSPAVARALREVDALQIPLSYGPLKVLTKQVLRRAHEHDVEVHVWTINDPARMRELVDFGVDGVVTDHADLAVKTLF
ncbi:glycerophosphodiester phosphodiesterase family protein [Microbacterium sp. NIBRBAC000506063]|uniref:glycerophosphodiester phosphodiesterase family protein n=1 Tax=Microbacterium sp. NIBRBAC000506063 TaxID=2734618 RepID=UPI001BB6F60C|nr:glycerophosphodiester phosphodiesterase family protein [Microbacterium sp. NIBRBAC000506063]QTV80827.1 glycerophosphodiester phosphodiesterase [Microbacterium sp. NIBRBAC000506063]